MDRPNLYTGRWHLLNGKAVPEGPVLDALLSVLEPILGPAPGQTVAAPQTPTEAPSGPPVYADWENGDLPPVRDVVWMVSPSSTLPIVGVSFSLPALAAYIASIDDDQMTWSPSGIVLHNTASPSLAMRPDGFLKEHMMNLRSYYLSLGWIAGPHFFVDDHQVWAFSPLVRRGTHSPSYNYSHIGIEMLGDFATEDPTAGRGRKVAENTAALVSLLNKRFKLKKSDLLLHKEDKKTTHDCPGKRLKKDWFLNLVK